MRRYTVEEIEAWLNEEDRKRGITPETEAAEATGFTVGEDIAAGDRHEKMFKLLRSQKARAMSLEAAVAGCHIENKEKCKPPIDFKELDDYLRRVWHQGDSPEFKASQAAKKTAKLITGEKEFKRAKGDRIVADDQDNVALALEILGVKLRYDQFAQRILIKHGTYDDALMDPIRNRVWLDIDKQLGFRPPPEFFDIMLQDIAIANKVHPVREYLDALTWDGVPRIENWLVNATGAATTAYIQAVSRLVLVAAVRRVRRPGCKFDEMLVLESDKQGLQKSSALRALAGNDSWFSDDLPLNVDAKQVIERTSGKWIIEAQELSGMHKSQAEHLKSMLSRQIDGPVRMAYARLPGEQPRQFIIIGTTNSSDYLSDSTGNRRYWPVRIEFCNLDFIARWKDQWWAEAAFYESQGESIRLNPALYGDAENEQEQRRSADPWEQRIEEAWGEEHFQRILPDEIWTLLNVPVERHDARGQARINAIMKRCGFRSQVIRNKATGKNVRGWARGESLRPRDE